MTDETAQTGVTALTCKNHGIQARGFIFGNATLCEECIRDFMLGHGVQQLFNDVVHVTVRTEVSHER